MPNRNVVPAAGVPRAPFQVLIFPPEYAFGVAVAPEAVVPSAEHDAVEWLAYPDAVARLRWGSNRAALRELHARLGVL